MLFWSKIDSGVLQYAVSTHVVSLSSSVVNDGKWHHVQVNWTSRQLVIDVDYGLSQVGLVVPYCCMQIQICLSVLMLFS